MEGGVVVPNEKDIEFMRIALDQAVRGRDTPGGAEVGAVLVRGGQVICAGFNEGEMRHDPTAHSEMVVIRRACEQLKTTSLEGTTLYCTLQPCGMCTMACLWAGISRIVYGARRDKRKNRGRKPVFFCVPYRMISSTGRSRRSVICEDDALAIGVKETRRRCLSHACWIAGFR